MHLIFKVSTKDSAARLANEWLEQNEPVSESAFARLERRGRRSPDGSSESYKWSRDEDDRRNWKQTQIPPSWSWSLNIKEPKKRPKPALKPEPTGPIRYVKVDQWVEYRTEHGRVTDITTISIHPKDVDRALQQVVDAIGRPLIELSRRSGDPRNPNSPGGSRIKVQDTL